MNRPPSKFALSFLKWFCPSHLEEIEGDLIQKFNRDVERFGEGKAKRRLLWSVIRFFRLGILLRYQTSFDGNAFALYLSYGKTTYRSLRKQPVYTLFNVISLTLGICAFLWIVLYAFTEWSYDRHYRDADDIYRVTTTMRSEADLNETDLGWSMSPLPEQLRSSFPEVESATGMVLLKDNVNVKIGNNQFPENNFYETDTSYFRVFEHDWIQGSPKIINQSSVVLTESLSREYFGDTDALGRIIEINHQPYTVAGILADPPANTSLRFKALLFTFNSHTSDWGFTFFKWHKHATVGFLQEKIDTLFKEEYADVLKESNTEGYYNIEPLIGIHFGKYKLMDAPKGSKSIVLILISVGGLILFISFINYTHLTSAFAGARKKEAAIRATLGALLKNNRVHSFLEFTWLGLSAFLLSAILIYSCWPWLDEFELENYCFSSRDIFQMIVLVVCMTVSIGLLTWVLIYQQQKVTPFAIILKQSGKSVTRSWLNALLIILQFSVSLVLVFASRVIVEQVRMISETSSYADEKQTLVIDLPQDSTQALQKKFNTAVRQLSFVSQSSFVGGGAIPTSESVFDIFKVYGQSGSAIQMLKYVQVDPHYFEVLNLKLIAGRLFQDGEAGDWDAVIVSESFVKAQGWKNDPLQNKICYGGTGCEGVPVLGVVRDEGYWGPQQKERPSLFLPLNKRPEKLIIKLSSIDLEKLEQVKTLWAKTLNQPLEYKFLDQYVSKQLERKQKLEQQIFWFSMAAILLVVTGLFGMIHVQLTNKKKETAIRKVFGATIFQLIRFGWKPNVIFLIAALCIAYPLSYPILHYWLAQFPSKVEISFAVFMETILLHLTVFTVAIGYHTWQLKRSKPLETIRYE
jgi:putative ABC transport system permease protein